MTNLTPNQAAAQAIQLFSQEARLCDGTQPSKVARTTLEPGPASLAKSLPVKNVNPTCSVEGIKNSNEMLPKQIQNIYINPFKNSSENFHPFTSPSSSSSLLFVNDNDSNLGQVKISVKLVDANLPLKMDFPELLHRNCNKNSISPKKTKSSHDQESISTKKSQLTENSLITWKNSNSQITNQLELTENSRIAENDLELTENLSKNCNLNSNEDKNNVKQGKENFSHIDSREKKHSRNNEVNFSINSKGKKRLRSSEVKNSKTNFNQDYNRSIGIEISPAKRSRKLSTIKGNNFTNIRESSKIKNNSKKRKTKKSNRIVKKGKTTKREILKKQINENSRKYRKKKNEKRVRFNLQRSVGKLFALAFYFKYTDSRK